MTTMEANITEMSWGELKTFAKDHGVATHKRKRAEIEADLEAKLTGNHATESPEETIARLKAELEAAKGAAPSNVSSDTPMGPNYWNMTHTQLKTLLQTCGGYNPAADDGSQASMIGQLQAADYKRGLAPHPKDQPVTITGKRGVVTSLTMCRTNSTGSPVRDVIFLKDQDGNRLFTVHAVGRITPDGPVLMDMTTHAERVMNFYNNGGAA